MDPGGGRGPEGITANSSLPYLLIGGIRVLTGTVGLTATAPTHPLGPAPGSDLCDAVSTDTCKLASQNTVW